MEKNVIKKTLEYVLKNLPDIQYDPDDKHRAAYIAEIRTKLDKAMQCTTLRFQSNKTDAYAYNKTAYELYVDITTSFNYINELYKTINDHSLLNQSIINTLYSSIASLNDKLDEYEAVIGSPSRSYCFIDGFRTQNNQEFDRRFYTERYGERVPVDAYALFNPYQENLTLNYSRQQNTIVYKSGVQLGKIYITKQYGAGFIKARNAETKIDNAIDTSLSSFWSETILADSEMAIKGQGFLGENGTKSSNRSFYDLPRGALCEVCIEFEAMSRVNEIVLKPFGDFPIDIVAIRYALTDDEDDTTYDILAPDNKTFSWLQPISIRKEYAFHFPEIQCKRLYILLNQLHCIKNTYILSSNQMLNNELWFNATFNNKDNVLKNSTTTVFKPVYLDKLNEDAIYRYLQNTAYTNKKINITDLLINNKNKFIPVTKYQYTYGFYNIAPNYSEFQRAGIYVSNEITIDGAIDTIKLTVEEERYKSSNDEILTDIEFYVTTKQNPSYKDWHSICPTNKKYVHRELLQLDYDYCYLRHKAVCRNVQTQNKDGTQRTDMVRPIVYYNDIVLTEDADYICRYDKDGNVYAIEISNIDHFALYTVSYQPVEESKEISIIDLNNINPNSSYEEIECNGTACYELYNYPFYNKTNPNITSSHLKITNTKTNQIITETHQEDSPIVCITNKINPENSYKNMLANSNKIQYYTSGRFLYLSKPLSNDFKIEISYPSFDCKVRLKAILRRNTKVDKWITPVLNKYKLEFTTIN